MHETLAAETSANVLIFFPAFKIKVTLFSFPTLFPHVIVGVQTYHVLMEFSLLLPAIGSSPPCPPTASDGRIIKANVVNLYVLIRATRKWNRDAQVAAVTAVIFERGTKD